MSTSGITTYRVNRDQLIKDALLMIEAIALEQIPSAAVIEHANRQLNLLVKSLETIGLNLWVIKKAYLFLNKGQAEYTIGTSSGDHVTNTYKTTTTTSLLSSGSTFVNLTSVLGMTVGDNVGILNNSGDFVWRTILTIVSNTITFAAYGSTANIGNKVFTYTNKITKPLQIVNAVALKYTNFIVPLTIISRDQWVRFTRRYNPGGQVTQLNFTPNENDATIKLFPSPADSSDVIEFYYQRPFEDMVNPTDDFDFPQEWLLFIQYSLALLLAPSYSVPANKVNTIAALASKEEERVTSFDRENNTSIFIQPRIKQ